MQLQFHTRKEHKRETKILLLLNWQRNWHYLTEKEKVNSHQYPGKKSTVTYSTVQYSLGTYREYESSFFLNCLILHHWFHSYFNFNFHLNLHFIFIFYLATKRTVSLYKTRTMEWWPTLYLCWRDGLWTLELLKSKKRRRLQRYVRDVCLFSIF